MPRGGARYDKDGNILTGRKKKAPKEKKKHYNTRLSQDLIDFLRSQDNAAMVIDKALRLYIEIEKKQF